jgi:uncharacterized protein (TIGR01244 family)
MSRDNCQALRQQVAAAPAHFPLYNITPDVTLAGQPEAADWPALAQAGTAVIINMRSDPARAAAEAEAAAAAGLAYLHLPLPAYELEPEHVALFARTLVRYRGRKLFIHCRTASRVALVWLLHRVQNEGWSPETAVAELAAAGYDPDSLETFTYCADDYFERAGVGV